jgi:hypothetical protein
MWRRLNLRRLAAHAARKPTPPPPCLMAAASILTKANQPGGLALKITMCQAPPCYVKLDAVDDGEQFMAVFNRVKAEHAAPRDLNKAWGIPPAPEPPAAVSKVGDAAE